MSDEKKNARAHCFLHPNYFQGSFEIGRRIVMKPHRQIDVFEYTSSDSLTLEASTAGHVEVSENNLARFVAEVERIRRSDQATKDPIHATEEGPPAAPPNVALLLRMVLPRETRENIIGDMEETFRTIHLPRHGPFWARCLYLRDVFWEIASAIWRCIRWFVGAGFLAKAADWISQKLSGG